ncbi:hypothetical protein COV15_00935 [Candidatus Woesearchaeota archaeon CG10_big_fil_rev_8_21_14_0_10_34_12]|nr:MAG: hypothetical protein COV15_00935 [Candidatus Woesearchaeota archaeon CG10_big_fil_rev_8_21_14_0_10_34_12]
MNSDGLKRGLYTFVILFMVAVASFSVFSFLAIRTKINVIDLTILAIKNTASDSIIAVLNNIQNSLGGVYQIALLEAVILTIALIFTCLALIHVLTLYFNAKKSSLIDSLTQIYNRRALNRILDNEIKRAERFKHPITIIMLDIDHFKIYNDKNGHVAGDRLLQKVSKIMLSKIRDVDTITRYGGEEFTIILPETSHKEAVRVAERIRKAVSDAKFKGEEKQPKGDVTISLGLVTFHGEYKRKKQMIHFADELLYKAKEEGRNQLKKAEFGKEIKQTRP